MKLPLYLLTAAVLFPLSARAKLIWHSFLDGDADAVVGADGAPNGAFQPTADRYGNAGGALLFDGSYHIDIGNFGTLTAGSISAWVRRDSTDTNERGAVAVGATGSGTAEYFSLMDQGGSVWRADLDDGDDGMGAGRLAASSVSAPSGDWEHIVVTFEAQGDLKLYVDGVLKETQSLAAPAEPSYTMSESGLIGGERSDGSRDFIGAIDDVRIYDHELDEVEIFNLGQIGPRFSDVIADSREDWSPTGTQGENGWSYGYYDRRADVESGNGTYDATEFIPFLNDGSGVVSSDATIGAWKSSPNHWDGAAWDLLQNPGVGPGPWTNMTQTAAHPAANGQGDPEVHWAVRRWTADQDYNPVLIEGVVHNTNSAGDGTALWAFRNGGGLGVYGTNGGAVLFAVADAWNAGDTLDFAIDPDGPGGTELNSIDDGADTTQFHARILDATVPPVLLEVEVTSPTTLRLRYSQLMDFNTTTDPFNYTVTEGMAFPAVLSASSVDSRTFDLVTDPLTPGSLVQIDVANVTNLALTELRGFQQSLKFRVPVFTSGLLRRDFYGSIAGVAVTDLINDPKFLDAPDSTCYTNTFEFNSADEADNYGGRLSGFYVADETGDHTFYIASDDAGELLLSTDANPANATVIAFEPQYNDRRDWTGTNRRNAADPENISDPILLTAGELYYIEARFKEGGGGDHLAVAVQKPSGSAPANGTDPIGPQNLAVLLPPGSLRISQQPQSQTVNENEIVTTSVGLELVGVELCPGAVPWAPIQWLFNGAAIPGATDPSLTGPASLDLDGVAFTAEVTLPGGVVTTDPAILTINADTTAPQLIRAYPDPASPWNRVIVEFDEPLEEISAADPFNYNLDPFITVIAVDQLADPSQVALNIAEPLDEGRKYMLTADSISDRAAALNTLFGATTPVHAHVRSGFGGLTFERYDGIGGVSVADLVNAAKFPNNPDSVTTLTRFSTPANIGDNFGGRVSGLFYPPTTGNWVFHLRSDDASQLFLNSSGTDPAGKVMIAEEPNCCRSFADVFSSPIALTAGQGYYIEGLYKEGGGGDYLQVAARLEGDPVPADANPLRDVIPSEMLNGGPTWLCFERYNDIPGVGVDALLNHPKFPNLPDETQFLTRFATPENIGDNFGARIRGVFFPPTTDDWVFYLRSDDASRLYLNPNGTDPAGKVMIAEEPDCCDAFADAASAQIRLEAGRGYYIECIYKEGAGLDFMQVAARRAGEPVPTDPVLHSLEGTMVGIPSSPAYALQGDLNRDGQVDISDMSFAANFMFLSGPSPIVDLRGPDEDLTMVDLNADGWWDFPDAIFESNYLFLAGPPFPAPFPALAQPCYDPRPYPAIKPDRMGTQLSFTGPAARSGVPGEQLGIPVTVVLTPGVDTEAWSFGLRPGAGTAVADVTTLGTDAAASFSGGFEMAQLTNPADNDGVEGAVSAMELSFALPVQFRPGEPKTILDATLRGTVPASGVSETWTLDFDANLKADASHQVVRVVTTHAGMSEIPELGAYSVQVTGGQTFADFIAPCYSGTDALPGADPELDGIPNVVEWLLGLDPKVFDAHLLPAVDYSGANPRLTLPKAQGIAGGDLFVERSTTLREGSWGSGGVTVITDDATELVVEFPPASPGNPETFVRIGGTAN